MKPGEDADDDSVVEAEVVDSGEIPVVTGHDDTPAVDDEIVELEVVESIDAGAVETDHDAPDRDAPDRDAPDVDAPDHDAAVLDDAGDRDDRTDDEVEDVFGSLLRGPSDVTQDDDVVVLAPVPPKKSGKGVPKRGGLTSKFSRPTPTLHADAASNESSDIVEDGAPATPETASKTSVADEPLDGPSPGRTAGNLTGIELQVAHAREQFESQVAAAKEQFEETNERIKQRAGRNIFAAVGVGVVAGGAVLAALLFAPKAMAIVAVAIAVLGVHELWRALRTAGRRIDLAPQLTAIVLILAAATFADTGLLWISLFVSIAFIVVWRLMAQMISADGRSHREVFIDVVIGSFVPIYVPLLVGTAVVLLQFDNGNFWVIGFLIVVVASDTAAYVTGLSFGKHPMAPRVSPKKTWEGFVGAGVAALGGGVLVAAYLLQLPWWAGLIFGAVILLTATIGDLGESMIKRDLGIKDMSSALPGHGGVLDRLDSVLPSAVAALALHFLLSPLVIT